MRILFDALGLPPYGGARTSALGWMCSVAEREPENRYFALVSKYESALEPIVNLEQFVAPVSGRFQVRSWAQMHIPRMACSLDIDVVHFTKNHGCFLVPCASVLTVNDLNRLYYPAMFSRIDVFYWKTIQRALLKNVNRVIAISQSTKRDLIRFYSLPRERIEVIYPGISSRFHHQGGIGESTPGVLQKYGIESPYILSVGGMAMHKNVYTALQAFLSLMDQNQLADHTFVIVGERFHTHNDQRLLRLTGQQVDSHVRYAGIVDDADLPTVYSGASLLVYPSLYEGFGLVPLEAMASGVPVLASRVGSLPEVLADAAYTVHDVNDVNAVADGMLKLLTNPQIREQYRERGLENVARFSWAKTGQQTLKLYQQLVSSEF